MILNGQDKGFWAVPAQPLKKGSKIGVKNRAIFGSFLGSKIPPFSGFFQKRVNFERHTKGYRARTGPGPAQNRPKIGHF